MRRLIVVSALAFTAVAGLVGPATAAPEPFCVGGSNGTAKPIACVQLPVRP